MTPEEEFQAIQDNIGVAEADYHDATGHEPRFDRATVAWIEQRALSFARGEAPECALPHGRALLYSVLGSAFAECLRRSFDAEWAYVNKDWYGIYIVASDLTLNPWKKIGGALGGEEGESPVGMFAWVEQKVGPKPAKR